MEVAAAKLHHHHQRLNLALLGPHQPPLFLTRPISSIPFTPSQSLSLSSPLVVRASPSSSSSSSLEPLPSTSNTTTSHKSPQQVLTTLFSFLKRTLVAVTTVTAVAAVAAVAILHFGFGLKPLISIRADCPYMNDVKDGKYTESCPNQMEALRISLTVKLRNKETEKDGMRNMKSLFAFTQIGFGNLDNALKVFQERVNEDPMDLEAYVHQGMIYTLMGKRRAADKQFNKCRRLIPKGHPSAKTYEDIISMVKSDKYRSERS